jgi:hypothetical protein
MIISVLLQHFSVLRAAAFPADDPADGELLCGHWRCQGVLANVESLPAAR